MKKRGGHTPQNDPPKKKRYNLKTEATNRLYMLDVVAALSQKMLIVHPLFCNF